MPRTPPSGRFVAETPPDQNCFIGFHDIIPWSPDGSFIAIHRAAPELFRLDDCRQPIEICLWDPSSNEIRAVDSTTGWNFQQGSRLQWLPGARNTLIFNTVLDGRAVAVTSSISTGERSILPAAIYALSPDGKTSIAPNFTTLAHRWKAYGYPALEQSAPPTSNSNDGLWRLDLESGKESLFIATDRAAKFNAIPNIDPGSHFLSHASFSPDGSRVVFLHRFFSADGALFTRMMVTDLEARTLGILAQEKVSHFDWFDNDTILVWARFSAGGLAKARARGLFASPLIKPLLSVARKITGRWKRQFLAESYYRISIKDPQLRSRFGWPALDFDGHPMIARSHAWLVTDFYPDRSGQLPLILYNADRNERRDVQVFAHRPRSTDTDVKCDLHPRWSRDERMIAVDTCESGSRQVKVFDVSDVVG